MPPARIADTHTCPRPTHVGGPVALGEFTMLTMLTMPIGAMPAAHEGDRLACTTDSSGARRKFTPRRERLVALPPGFSRR